MCLLLGLTCIQKKRGGTECLCVLQLTEAGDIFYQILTPDQPDITAPPSAAEDELLPPPATNTPPQPPDSQVLASEMSSDDDAFGPTQDVTVQRFIAESPKKEQQSANVSEDSEAEGGHKYLKQWPQVVTNDDPELDQVSGSKKTDGKPGGDKVGDAKEPGVVEVSTCGSRCLSHAGTTVQPSKQAVITWKTWLQKLMRKSCEKKPHRLPHFTITTKDLLNLPSAEARDPTEEELVLRLKQNLRGCMSKRSLLIHSTVSSALSAPDVVHVPNQVDTEVWSDPLSRRLTLSWQGEGAWQAWWEDHLGLNREKKVEALRRKRREKAAKRASGQRLELSGSFTSGISYQSDFSDLGGWSSAASQSRYSDLSQDSFRRSGFSQSLSQSSKGQPGTSQSSQPKKKSRMGFWIPVRSHCDLNTLL